MSKKWYGSINNRLEEDRQFCDCIEVGTGVTEYHYTDRDAYEVIKVIDQKHVIVREYDHKHTGEAYENRWELVSNEANPERYLTKRGEYWYWTMTVTADVLADLESDDADTKINTMLWLCQNGIDADKLREKGKITKYIRAKVSFGVADYHFDFEF